MSRYSPALDIINVKQLNIDLDDPRYGFGVDIGGSGVKGGIVDLHTGYLVGDRFKIKTPKPSKPLAVASTVTEIVKHFSWNGAVGITLPAVVSGGIVRTAANIDHEWVGIDPYSLFGSHLTPRKLTVLNDADAAGIAEARFGVGVDKVKGVVIVLTLGTGIGSAILLNGEQLLPNTELGHMQVGDLIAEDQASARAKEEHDWSYERWAGKLSRVLHEYEKIFSPTRFILGGGISRKASKWISLLNISTPVMTAKLLNTSGIVGAAIAARDELKP